MKTVRQGLRDKLPEILLEAVSILLAVFLALAVDQWRERRAQEERADIARQRIVAELSDNTTELKRILPMHEEILVYLDGVLEALENEADDVGLDLDLTVAVLSATAWETALATDAVNYMDFDWVAGVTRAHASQALYQQTQTELLRNLSALGESAKREPEDVVGGLRGRLDTSLQLGRSLLDALEEIIDGEAP